MIFAFFTACLINSATGDVECRASYTEMTSVMRKGESCEALAKEMQDMAINTILIENPGYISAFPDVACGTKAEMRAMALAKHKSNMEAGITSSVFEF